MPNEREIVTARIKATLVDASTKQPFVYAIGDISLFIESIDASPDFLAKLFAKNLKVSIYQAARYLRTADQ